MKDKKKKKKEKTPWVLIASIATLIITFTILLLQRRNQVIEKRHNEHKLTLSDLMAKFEPAKEEKSSEVRDKSGSAGEILVKVPGCDCVKTIKAASGGAQIDRDETTCGAAAFARGSHQKIFSFSFFGEMNSDRKYFEGIEMNAKAVKDLFPDWTVRVYHNVTDDMDPLCALECRFDNLDFCDVSRNPMLGNLNGVLATIWRFSPLADAQVDVVNFRDLDSIVSEREAAAVNAWIVSKHAVHVMRDHAGHDLPILAGMWAAKLDPLRITWRKVLKALLQDELSAITSQQGDQILLERYVWPWAEEKALQHDSFHCETYSRTTAWPTKRNSAGNYVGAPFAAAAPITERCPEKCRPRNHKDWIHC